MTTTKTYTLALGCLLAAASCTKIETTTTTLSPERAELETLLEANIHHLKAMNVTLEEALAAAGNQYRNDHELLACMVDIAGDDEGQETGNPSFKYAPDGMVFGEDMLAFFILRLQYDEGAQQLEESNSFDSEQTQTNYNVAIEYADVAGQTGVVDGEDFLYLLGQWSNLCPEASPTE